MLSLQDVARLEEARVAAGVPTIADESRAIAGGSMSRGAPGTWCNLAAGLAMAGEVRGEELDGLVEFYVERGIEPRVELCPFAHESLTRGLGERGFVARSFEMVFYREVDAAAPAAGLHEVAGLSVRRVDPGDEAAVMVFARIVVSGFMPEGAITPDLLESAARSVRKPTVVAAGAWIDGRCVGGGTMSHRGGAAGLHGLSVLPEYRRRGVQQALMAYRMNEAAKLGCRIVTIGALPGAGTERNARRMGFQLGYTKVVVVRPGAGLVAMAE